MNAAHSAPSKSTFLLRQCLPSVAKGTHEAANTSCKRNPPGRDCRYSLNISQRPANSRIGPEQQSFDWHILGPEMVSRWVFSQFLLGPWWFPLEPRYSGFCWMSDVTSDFNQEGLHFLFLSSPPLLLFFLGLLQKARGGGFPLLFSRKTRGHVFLTPLFRRFPHCFRRQLRGEAAGHRHPAGLGGGGRGDVEEGLHPGASANGSSRTVERSSGRVVEWLGGR